MNPVTVVLVNKSQKESLSFSDVRAYGAILTSDGWIAALHVSNDTKGALYAVRSDGSILEVERRIEDPALMVDYFKIKANGLPTIDFLQEEEFYESLNAYAFIPRVGMEHMILVRRWYVSDSERQSVLLSSDRIQKVYPYAAQFQSNGAPVFSEQGAFVGLAGPLGVIPSLYIQNDLKKLLTKGSIAHIELHIPYIDLALMPSFRSTTQSGARVTTDTPIAIQSRKGNVVLSNGDSIIKVNDEDVNENQSLSELLAGYTIDDDVSLTIRSARGEEKNIALKLK